MAKYEAPDLSNATPTHLIDESARLSIIENWAKWMRKVYKEALYARLNLDPALPLNEQSVDSRQVGESFVGNIGQHSSNRFDLERFKADHPTLYAQYLKSSVITALRFDLREGAVKPAVASLIANLRKELELDDDKPTE